VSLGEHIAADLVVSCRSPGLNDELLALLPQRVQSGFDAIRLNVGEGLSTTDARVRLERAGTGDGPAGEWSSLFDGRITISGGSMLAGIPFEAVTGLLDVHAEQPANAPPRLRIQVEAPSALAAGRRIENVSAEMHFSVDGAAILIPHFMADMYGGAATARAAVNLDEPRTYSVKVDLVGVDLAGLSVNLAAQADASPDAPQTSSKMRGDTYASLRLSGVVDQPESRRGRGALRILHGRLASMPLGLRLLQLAQFMLPLHGSLDSAELDFYVEGDTVVFEEIVIDGPTLILFGTGTMGFSTFEVDLRLRSRGTLMTVSDILGSVNDQIFAIHVTGPLGDPQASVVPMPGVGDHFADEKERE
jgi:hypothetical protein